MPNYQVWIEDATYSKVAFLNRYVALTYTQVLNDVGYATLELHPDDAKIADVVLGRRLKIVRDGEIVFGGVILREAWKVPDTAPRGEVYTFTALDHAAYAKFRLVVPAAGEAYQTYTDHADDVAKDYVYYNLGAGAAAARQFSDVSVAADQHAATSITDSARYETVLSRLQRLASAGGFDWRFVPGAAGCTFTTAYPHWGLDRRKGNGVNDEFVMSPDRGTFQSMDYVRDAADSANYVYVAGQGEGADRTVVERSDSAGIAELGRMEAFVDARDLSLTSSLEARGDGKLLELAPEAVLMATPTQGTWKRTAAPTWDVGDLITIYVRRWGREFAQDCKVIAVKVEVTADNLETVTPTLEAV